MASKLPLPWRSPKLDPSLKLSASTAKEMVTGSGWYVSNVSIIYEVFMLIYYHSSMFYNHFIAILYHFLGLTYWPSAQCQLLFFCLFFTSQEINIKWTPNTAKLFVDFLCTRRHPMGQNRTWGCPEGGTTHLGAPRGSRRNTIPATASSSTTKSNLDTITDGVHYLHWCLSDDAWVVLCRPSGP